MNSPKKTDGFTLIELLVTLVISTLVMSYAMIAFTDLGKGFGSQRQQSKSVLKMIITKKQIENSIGSAASIESWTSTSLSYKKQNSDSLSNVQFRDGVLYSNRNIICSGVRNFTFAVEENSSSSGSNNNSKVLLWECLVTDKRLIGGAVVVGE